MSNVIPLDSRRGPASDEEAVQQLCELAVLEIAQRLARAAAIEKAAKAHVAQVRDHKRKGWHRVPMETLEQLADLVED